MITVAGLTALCGCAEQRRAEAQAALQRQIAVCLAQYPEGTHFLDKARCDESARREALLAAGAPDDLAEVFLATRADVAVRMDRGEITREQADLVLAKTRSELSEKLLARRQAAAAVIAAMPPPTVYQMPPPAPIQFGPRPTYNTNCTQMGAFMNCTTY